MALLERYSPNPMLNPFATMLEIPMISTACVPSPPPAQYKSRHRQKENSKEVLRSCGGRNGRGMWPVIAYGRHDIDTAYNVGRGTRSISASKEY